MIMEVYHLYCQFLGGQKEVSSLNLPIYDGDYYSVMLQKRKVETNLFPNPSFEVGSGAGLYNPPFVTQSFGSTAVNGDIEIVSSSNVAKVGAKSLRHRNTAQTGTSYTIFFNNPNSISEDYNIQKPVTNPYWWKLLPFGQIEFLQVLSIL